MGLSKRKTGKFIVAILWMGIGAALVVLLLAAIRKRDDKTCSGMEIEIKDAQHHLFADKNDIKGMLIHMMPAIKGSPLADFDLRKMEQTLESNVWIKDAELFFDNNEVLRVKIEERKPLARIFTTGGRSYYIDNELIRLPLSSRLPADVPVFTSCPLDKTKWNAADSTLLLQVKAISEFISANAFWMAQIEQINYADEKRFELYPKVGEHVIILGDGYNLEQKFSKLYTFYSEVLAKVGWDTYSTIDVQYSRQVVATRKNTAQPIIIQNQLNHINSYATQ